MGLPVRNVEFQNQTDKPELYVHWDNILYRPEAFTPIEHYHSELEENIFNNLIQVVATVPSNTRKGQLFFIRK